MKSLPLSVRWKMRSYRYRKRIEASDLGRVFRSPEFRLFSVIVFLGLCLGLLILGTRMSNQRVLKALEGDMAKELTGSDYQDTSFADFDRFSLVSK